MGTEMIPVNKSLVSGENLLFECKNKDADQLCDQRLCFRYIDSTIPPLKSKISSLHPSSAAVKPDLCWTWLETSKAGFLMIWLKLHQLLNDSIRRNPVLRILDTV